MDVLATSMDEALTSETLRLLCNLVTGASAMRTVRQVDRHKNSCNDVSDRSLLGGALLPICQSC